MRWLFLEIILLSLSLPLLLTFMLRTACFDQRWLASIYVLFVFALFGIKSLSGICTEIKVSQLVVISLIIFSTFSLKALSYTVVLGPHTLARPNAAIARALKTSDSPIYVVEDLNLYGALKVQLPERNIYYVSKDKFLETSPSKALVLWDAAELKRFNPAAQQSHSRVRIEYIRLPYEHFDFAIRFRGLVQQLLSFRTSLISQELLKGEDLYYILGTYES